MVLDKLKRVFGQNPKDMSDDALRVRALKLFSRIYDDVEKHSMEDVIDLEEARYYLRRRGWHEVVSLELQPPEESNGN